MAEGDFRSALLELRQRGVDFIVVGGLAAVLHGAPVVTFDLDLVYDSHPLNLQKLEVFLQDADAIFRMQAHRRLRPNLSHLAALGHLNLITRFGPIDMLGTIGAGLAYNDLLPLSTQMDLSAGQVITVLNLQTIIDVKEFLGSSKDRAVLPILYETLKARRS